MAQAERSFWHTAPGIITALAALITAIGGVLGILIQNDLIGSESAGQVSSPPPDVNGSPGAADVDQNAPGVSATPQSDASPLIPWEQATATLVRGDGTSVTVKAPTVTIACDSENLSFKNGQRVSLEKLRSVQFDAIYTENQSADGVVTLLDGRQLTDPIHTWNCPIFGTNELGSLRIELVDIARIDFHR